MDSLSTTAGAVWPGALTTPGRRVATAPAAWDKVKAAGPERDLVAFIAASRTAPADRSGKAE
jgi:hypothetical protein